MKTSLVTVCYNSAGTIGTAVESVFSQKGAEVEYIVVDGGSTDGTVEALARFEKAAAGLGGWLDFKWSSGPDEGMYDALNKGIASATGDIVGILNADDVLESPDTLSHVAAAFGDGIDAVYADVRFVKADLETTVRYYGARHWRPWMHNWGYMPPHPSVYVRRGLFGRLGGYRLGYRISADFELMVRYFCRNGISAAYLPECVVKMRMGGKSTKDWRANVLLNVENVRANRENGYFSCFAMMLPKYLFKVWGFVFRRGRRATRAAALSAVAAAALAASGCSPAAGRVERVEWAEMGTVAAVSFRGGANPALADAVRAEYASAAAPLNAWDPGSELSRLSSTNGWERRVSPSARPCYAAAFSLMHETEGAFNPLLAEKMRARGFTRKAALVDLGGIAKGFAVDCAFDRARGVSPCGCDWLLDLGGNLRAGRGDWRVGVRDPLGNGLCARAVLREGEAMATSGTYERGKHILDGRTGLVVSNGVASASVIAPSAMLADALSTALFVMGPDEGGEFLRKRHADVAALWVMEDGSTRRFDGAARFSP